MAIELARAERQASPGAAGVSSGRKRRGRAGGTLTLADRRFFTERLALLLETGTPLHAALLTLAGQSRSDLLAGLARRLHDDVSGGKRFEQALAAQGDSFPATYVNLVGAAERGGFLDEVLRRLAEMDERNAQLRATIRSALFYPAFLLAFSGFVVVFVLTVVFPKFAPLFAGLGDQLPMTTVWLMAASDLMRERWALVLGALAGLAVLVHLLLVSEAGRLRTDQLKLSLPGVRTLFAEFYLSRVMRVLGLSLQHGVGVPDALQACRGLVRNAVFDRFLAQVQEDVEQGRGVGPSFRRSRFVPEMVGQMVATGEESAKLPLVMSRVADFYERELTRRLNTLSKMVEPVMLLVMGALVGLLVSSLILPIFKLSRVAH